MKAKLFLIFNLFLFLSLLFFILFKVEVKPDGDIVEYYGVTETVLNHASLDLRQNDIDLLLSYIDAPKFENPGYYLSGREHNRYPVHFWAYSLLLIPARLGLETLGFNPLLSLPVTNLLIFALSLIFVYHKFVRPSRRLAYLSLLLFSPLIFYLTWPGPDMWYLCLLLIAVFYAFKKHYSQAAFLTALASWHSQPLVLLAILFSALALYENRQTIMLVLGAGMVTTVPYLYNLYAFGTLTPWLGLQNAYASINGFGLQNISIFKLFEQFFDPNIGLFWYGSVLIFLSIIGIKHFWQERQWERLVVVLGFLLTALFYQTNPAWHYGTTGYGPTRHIIFFLPLLIYLSLKNSHKVKGGLLGGMFVICIAIQGYSLLFNGFIYPDTTRSLFHTPYARYFLNNYPQVYNPTPEIFIDRTLNLDTMLPQSAIYREQGICKKAYILPNGQFLLKQKCGFIPKSERNKLKKLENLSIYQGVYVNY
jgi:hypothetical protein